MVMPAFDVLTKICNTVQLISMGYGNANPGIVEVRLKVDPLRPLGQENILMLRIGFHPFEDLLPPLGQPASKVAETGHKPYVRLLVVQDMELVPEEYGLGEVVGHMETPAVVSGIAIRTTDVTTDNQVDVFDQGFDTDRHGRLFIVQADFLVVEIVDDDRFTWLASPVRKIVSQVGKIIVDAYLLHLRLQLLPIAALPLVVDFVVQRNQMEILFVNVAHDLTLELAAEVQVLQPDEVSLILYASDDGRYICDARENGLNEADGADSLVVELFHSSQAAFDAGGIIHIVLEVFVQGVDRPGNRHLGKSLQKVDIPQDQV